jgi:hypothetical protein
VRRVVKTLQKPDALAQVDILDCDNCLFVFEEKTWTIEDNPATWEHEGYWLPTYVSGYYPNAEAAETDARATIPWLRERRSD